MNYSRFVRNRRYIANIDRVCFDLELGELIDRALYLGGFEPDVVSAIEHFCQSDMVVSDICAKIGSHGLRMGSIDSEKGRIYAFEPTTIAFKQLEKNLALNPLLMFPHLPSAVQRGTNQANHLL